MVEVRAERMVAGGRALSRTEAGEVVLVAGALPGERVRARVHRRKGAALGELDEVLDALQHAREAELLAELEINA